jgi:hypothetical protein
MPKKSGKTIKNDHSLADKLWGGTGPYSQVRTTFETRIIDDKISRVFVTVEVDMNPATFEFVQAHRDLFKKDVIVLEFLDHADYRGQNFGYVSSAFSQELIGPETIEQAKVHEEYCIKMVLKLHRLVMAALLSKKSNQNNR